MGIYDGLANAGALAGYGVPTRIAPQWYVGYLTFRQGYTQLKRSSLTGGGQLYKRDNVGKFQPVIVVHSGPTVSQVGGGILPQNMPYLTSLYANPSGNNQGVG